MSLRQKAEVRPMVFSYQEPNAHPFPYKGKMAIRIHFHTKGLWLRGLVNWQAVKQNPVPYKGGSAIRIHFSIKGFWMKRPGTCLMELAVNETESISIQRILRK